MAGAMIQAEILLTVPMMQAVTTLLDESFTVHRLWEQSDVDYFLNNVGPRVRGVVTSTLFGRVEGRLLDRLPELEIIASFGVGYDNVDVAAAAAHGVVVTNTPGVLD